MMLEADADWATLGQKRKGLTVVIVLIPGMKFVFLPSQKLQLNKEFWRGVARFGDELCGNARRSVAGCGAA
jgi:hypothetical protein